MAEPNEDDFKCRIKQISTVIDNILSNIEELNTANEGEAQKVDPGVTRNT